MSFRVSIMMWPAKDKNEMQNEVTGGNIFHIILIHRRLYIDRRKLFFFFLATAYEIRQEPICQRKHE